MVAHNGTSVGLSLLPGFMGCSTSPLSSDFGWEGPEHCKLSEQGSST